VPILVPELEDLCPPEDRVDLRLILHHLFVGAAGDGSLNIPETVLSGGQRIQHTSCAAGRPG
jgi:hypothetical protein